MKKLEISKKEEIIGGYDVWMCSILSIYLAVSDTLTNMEFIHVAMLYDAYDCIPTATARLHRVVTLMLLTSFIIIPFKHQNIQKYKYFLTLLH
jgi:hypothetical protein